MNSARSTQYRYDSTSRLIQAQTTNLTVANTWQLAFGHDRWGNRLSQSLTGGTGSSVTAPQLSVDPLSNHISTPGYVFDVAGNMTNDSLHAYTYDAENHITSVDGTVVKSSYDGNRHRVVKGTTRYIYSGDRVIAEYSNGALASEYVYMNDRLIATLPAGTAPQYHLKDHLSTRVTTDGTNTGTYGHLPFGETWYETAPTSKWKFTDYERDATTEGGLDVGAFRAYSSRLGRFMQVDPAGLVSVAPRAPQSWNRYSYALNDPLNVSDPKGLFCQWEDGTRDDDPSDGGASFDDCVNEGGHWVDTTTVNVVAEGDIEFGSWGENGMFLGMTSSVDGCLRATPPQQLAIALAQPVASRFNRTVLFGLGITGGAGFGHGVGMLAGASAQIGVSPSGQAAYVITISAPVAATGVGTYPLVALSSQGKGVIGGAMFGFSNAQNPSDLSGSSLDGSAGGAAGGLAIGGDISTNLDGLYQMNVTLGFGTGEFSAGGVPT